MNTDNNSPVEAQALTLADIEKNYQITGDSKAADAALQRLAREREAREEARGRARLFDIDPVVAPSDDDWFGDLEDAAPEPEAVATAVVEPPAKGDDWGTPLEFPDLRLEVKFRKESLRVTKARIAKEEKQARTAKNTARKKRLRAAVAAKQPPRPPKPARFPVEFLTSDMQSHFREYVSLGDTHLARSLRGRIRVYNLIVALKVYLDYAGQLGRDPTHNEFAKAMAWKPNGDRKARRTVTVLSKVFTECGFGAESDLAKWNAEHAEAEAAELPFVDRETRGAGAL